MDNTAPDRQWVTCPGCSEAFDPESEAQSKHDDGSLQCPFCSTRFAPGAAGGTLGGPDGAPEAAVATGDAEAFVVEDDTPPPAAPGAPADEGQEISTNRVRQLSALRRAAYRSRSYCVMAGTVMLVAVVQLAALATRRVGREGWDARAIGYVFFGVAALMGAMYFARKIVELTRELRRPVLLDPETPPDFSTLSDGSQYWKRLQDM